MLPYIPSSLDIYPESFLLPIFPQVFSAMHVSGEQLNQLSGIAAILRFPLPELEDQEIPAPED